MVLNSIEKLLEKYDNGETTLKEEKQLQAYFAQDEIPPHLESYKVMFQYFNRTKQERYTKDVQLKTRTYTLYRWMAVAAVTVLMFAVFTQVGGKKTLADLNSKELMAYNETVKALNLVSSKFNQGATSLNALNMAGTQLEKGVERVNYIGEFSEATNKIFKNK
ncbi:MAG TPA: hypothetical protein VJ945_01570 [Flavobacteriaceae bacterium]|nr:hypothetical protein [Flavobacteriaceae bacterium]